MSLKVDGDLNINIVVVDEDPELAFKPNLLQMHSSYVVTDPKGYNE